MKGTGKFILGTAVVTGFVLIYVHLHLSLFGLSYSIYQKSRHLTEMAENYRRLEFEVNQLKAPNRLADQMKRHAMELNLPSDVYVLRIPENTKTHLDFSKVESPMINPLSQGLLEFVGRWVNVAQAKTDSKGV